MSRPLRVGLVAGEASGDTLGADSDRGAAPARAGLRNSSAWRGRRCRPRAARSGSRPSRSRSWDCSSPARSAALAAAAARACARMFLAARPDVFVGIDAPDTNLRLARRLHAAGIPTVQYVSPQVWAWRQRPGRAASTESVDLVLCLLPFEKRFYESRASRPSSSAIRSPMPFRSPSIAQRRARALGLRPPAARSSRCCPAAGAARWRGWRRTSPRPPRWLAAQPSRLEVHRADGELRRAARFSRACSSASRPGSRCSSSTARRRPR